MFKLLQIQDVDGKNLTTLLLNTESVGDKYKAVPFIRSVYRTNSDNVSADINEVIVRFLEPETYRHHSIVLWETQKGGITATMSDIKPL